MYRKFSQGWFKHFDFIVIDLLCVQFSFFAAAFWRHRGFPYYDKIYVNTAILLFFIDVLTCIFFSTYANVLRRGYLKEHGVTEAQGYFYYKPMPAEEFEKLLAYV